MAFRREWQLKLHAAGWAGISWPKEYGGRGATMIEQAIFVGEAARQEAPSPGQRARPGDGRPGRHRPRHRRAEAALPGADPDRRGDLVPGLLRARVRLRPRLAEDPRGQGRRRMGGHRAEGLDHLRPVREVVHARRPHRPRRAQAPGPHLLPDGHGAGRAWRRSRWSRSPARASSTRSSSRRRGSPTRTSSAASATAGRWRSRR